MDRAALFFALVLARVAAFVAVMPLFSGRSTPRLVRAGLALSLAVFWFGHVAPPPDLQKMCAEGSIPWLTFGVALGREALLGGFVGLLFNLFLAPVRIAGEFVTQQIGLAQASLLGAAADSAAGPLTIIFETLAGLIFLELNGHHIILSILHASFARHPLGGAFMPVPVPAVVESVVTAEALGVLLAGPLALAMFLVTIVLALMARVAPQLNIYSVGFTLQAIVAITGAMFLLPDLLRLMVATLSRVSEMVRMLI
jgi:flagellar biosynthetic protein FliR